MVEGVSRRRQIEKKIRKILENEGFSKIKTGLFNTGMYLGVIASYEDNTYGIMLREYRVLPDNELVKDACEHMIKRKYGRR